MKAHNRSKRKPTGGLYHSNRKKKKRDIGTDFIPVQLKDARKKSVRTLGGGKKIALLQENHANVLDPATRQTKRVRIVTVKENPANPHFVRMNILTKGAVIETELGLARITSRPGQDGVISAVLLKKA
jgi:small subunit ribosomal protein S8e